MLYYLFGIIETIKHLIILEVKDLYLILSIYNTYQYISVKISNNDTRNIDLCYMNRYFAKKMSKFV